MAKNPGLIKILAIAGCILAIIGAIITFAIGWMDTFWGIISPIIVILLAVLMLAAKGVIPLKKKLLPDTWIVVLIVGIVFIVIGWLGYIWIGGVLLVVSALLDHFT